MSLKRPPYLVINSNTHNPVLVLGQGYVYLIFNVKYFIAVKSSNNQVI